MGLQWLLPRNSGQARGEDAIIRRRRLQWIPDVPQRPPFNRRRDEAASEHRQHCWVPH